MNKSMVEASTEIVADLREKGRIRVLHVDDDQVFLKVAKQCLSTQGEFEVDTASSVNEALEKLKKTDYDAIVSDYQMPSKVGLEFVKELREKGNTVPFVVFTGKGREEIVIKAFNLGADQYIDKHGDPETVYFELAHAVSQAVDRKSAQIESLKREAKLHAILESSPEATTVVDLNGTIIDCNQATLDVYGYTSKSEVIGQHSFNLVSEKDHKRALEDMKRTLEQGSTKSIEYTATKKDGGEFHVEISRSVVRDPSGNPIGLVSVTKDITERKKNEGELKESKTRLDVATEASQIGVWELNLINDTSVRNSRHDQIFGYKKKIAEWGAKTFFKHIIPEDRPSVQAAFDRAMKTDRLYFECRILWPDKSIHWITATGRVVRDSTGKPQKMYGTVTETTERKKAEQAWKESEEKYRSLVELAPDGIVAVNTEGIVTSVNRSFLTLVGYDSEEEIVGKPFTELATSRVEDIPKFQSMFKSLLEGESPSPVEFLYVRRDGTSRWAEVHPSLLVKDGKPVGAQVIMRDVTERKKTEEEKSRLLHDLHERVKELNCLYDVSRLVEKSGLSLDGTLQGTADLLPPSSQYPDITCARIVVENREFSTKNFKETDWKLQADIEVHGKKAGFVEVSYLEERPTIAEGPFPEEERLIIAAIAGRLGRFIERKKAEGALRDAEEKWASLTENTDDIIMIVDGNGIIQFINRTVPPYTPEETIGKPIYEYVPKEQHDVMEKALREVFKTGTPDKYEVSSNIPAIGTSWFSTKIVPTKQDGNISGAILISANITDQKKAREEDEKAAETWRTTFDSISDFVFVLDRDQRFVRVNKAVCEALKKESRELIGKRCFEVLHGTNEPWPNCPFRKTLVTKKATTEEVNDPNLGIPLLVSVSPIFDGEGAFVGVVHIAKDITERKKMEKVLRDSEERLSTLFELAPDAYYLSDLKGNFIDGNKAAEKLTGYMRDELIGKSFMKLKLLPRNEALKAAKLLIMNALGKSTGPDELVLNRKDGTQVPVEIRTHPIKIKDKTVVLGIARDIATRKEDERAIKESQQKFEGLFRNNPEASVYLDSDLRILDANSRFCQLFGYSAKEVEGKQINEVVVPEDMIEEAESLDKDAKKGYASRDTVRKRKDGSLVHVSISATPVTIEGKPLCYVGVYKDITNLKEAEGRLKEVNKRLEVTNEKLHVVGGLTRHDVRNKLTAVTGNAYLLKRKLAGDPTALEQLNDVEAAVRLVGEIFEFARVYEKLGTEQLVNIDVGKAVEGAVSLFSGLKGVKVVNECGGLTVLADSLLSQLFYNLIDNSLKYGEKTQQIKIYCKSSSSNQFELVYEDDGVGIPDNMRSNLFKEGVTSGKGTGYGLFMVKRICEVYGWTIRETGRQGKGAQFTMSIDRNLGVLNHNQ